MGTPGVGKTTFSRLLAEILGAVHIDIGRLVSREKLVSGYDRTRRTYIADLKAVSRRIKQIIESTRKDVIIDGHYAADVVEPSRVDLVFVLRCDPLKLERRLKAKGWKRSKIKENVQAEILGICLADAVNKCGLEKVCEIDVTYRPVRKWVSRASDVVAGKVKPFITWIDWMAMLSEEGKLERYMAL